MQKLVRTTITIPENLLKIAKHNAVNEGKPLSRIIGEILQERLYAIDGHPNSYDEKPATKKIHMELGSLSLGVESSLKREEIYEDHIRHKIPR